MTAVAQRIEKEIENLSLEDMLVLHQHLVTSIHQLEDSQHLDPAFRAEIQQRLEEIDSGGAKGVDAFDALKEM
jgi:hypothetical protein